MTHMQRTRSVTIVAGLVALLMAPAMLGQNFGSAFTKKKIVLERKLPPTGHIDGTGIKVVVNAVGVQGDIAPTLKSDVENILLRNDPRLHTEETHPDTIITCTVTSYAQPAPVRTAQQGVSFDKKKPAAPQYMERVTATITVGFKATSRSGHSIAADNVKANYDREFNVTSNTGQSTGVTNSILHSISSAAGHVKPSSPEQQLSYTASDAKSFADVLLSPQYGHFKQENVHILLNDEATTRHIKEQLNWLARSAAPDDLVVVYIAAHGSPREVDTAGVSYIITHDTDIGTNPDKPDVDSLYATALPMVDLANAVATRVRAQRTAIFLDTCFSGNAAQPQNKFLVPGIPSGAIAPATL